MSASVYYSTQRKGKYIGSDVADYIKHKIQEEGIRQLDIQKNSSEYFWLKGLRDAQVKGAKELIDVIDEFSSIEVWLEY